MKRIDMIDELANIVEIGRMGMSPLTNVQLEAVEMARKMLVDLENVVCGACDSFGDETCNGLGWCHGHGFATHCSSNGTACLEFEFRTDSEY